MTDETKGWTRDQMAARAAWELEDGYYVNLGIGIPTLVANHIPEGMMVTLQSENGMLGIGPFPYEDEVDPVAGVKKIIVVMDHNAKDGSPKFIPECTLPLTGAGVVDMIITNLGVFQRPDMESPFRLIELAPGVSAEEVAQKTTAHYETALENA
ncbi:MAG: hypothetical protein GVX90_03170 [Alphaproteobacteria bacterium]|jgi:acyl CoA:acetate/3-ketoacid CoA transferase beta subunit|nr:hypothetical protein [Alphaproteobacteria bacterium]